MAPAVLILRGVVRVGEDVAEELNHKVDAHLDSIHNRLRALNACLLESCAHGLIGGRSIIND
jgi:hypothetical protein